ncbi:MAG: hypothetical protein LQ348_003361 [Seirophora lacunosa]|nr:MAG: hypothetical protein LQ348_003361 [Seirophora lacunosa]
MLAADPSVSSSYSRSSYLAMQTNTPLSPVAQEPDWPVGQGTCPEESNFYPAFSLGEPSEAAGYPTEHHDSMSVVAGQHFIHAFVGELLQSRPGHVSYPEKKDLQPAASGGCEEDQDE